MTAIKVLVLQKIIGSKSSTRSDLEGTQYQPILPYTATLDASVADTLQGIKDAVIPMISATLKVENVHLYEVRNISLPIDDADKLLTVPEVASE